MLSQAEAIAFARGQLLKRYVRAAAALHELYDDTSLSDAAKVKRGTVAAGGRARYRSRKRSRA